MDAKSPNLYSATEEAAPPSYSETYTPTHQAQPTLPPVLYSQQLRTQLQDLAAQITAHKTHTALLTTTKDETILSHLTPHITTYLSDLAGSGLRQGSLILVPLGAFNSPNAVPCSADFADPTHFDRVVRVASSSSPHAKSARDEYHTQDTGKSESWFWQDEDMARRIAAHLSPPPDPTYPPAPSIPQHNEFAYVRVNSWGQQVSSDPSSAVPAAKKSFWGRRKSSIKAPDTPPRVPVSAAAYPGDVKGDSKQTSASAMEAEDRVRLDVCAEEVVFRTEDEMGLFGTERGWAVVFKLTIRAA